MKGRSMPGPGQYGRADAPRPSTGVKFTESNAKSDIEPVKILQNTFSDRTHCIAQLWPGSSFLRSALQFLDRWRMYRASKIPGPGQYKVPAPMDGNDGRGVKFSDAHVASELEKAINRGRQLPGPGDYTPVETQTRKKVVGASKFSDSNAKNDLARLQISSAQNAAHFTATAWMLMRAECSMMLRQDWAIHRAQSMPVEFLQSSNAAHFTATAWMFMFADCSAMLRQARARRLWRRGRFQQACQGRRQVFSERGQIRARMDHPPIKATALPTGLRRRQGRPKEPGRRSPVQQFARQVGPRLAGLPCGPDARPLGLRSPYDADAERRTLLDGESKIGARPCHLERTRSARSWRVRARGRTSAVNRREVQRRER